MTDPQPKDYSVVDLDEPPIVGVTRIEVVDGIEADALPAGRDASTTHVGSHVGLYNR